MYSESVHEPNIFTVPKVRCLAAKESRVIVAQHAEGQFFTRIIAETAKTSKARKLLLKSIWYTSETNEEIAVRNMKTAS